MTDHQHDQPPFIITKEYRRFAEFCDACRRYRYIGVCYGPPGVGKTVSARQYAHWDVLEPLVPGYLLGPSPPIDARGYCTILYTPTVTHSPQQIARELYQRMHSLSCLIEDSLAVAQQRPYERTPANRVELVLVDEADRLKLAGLEQLRDSYDRDQVSVIVIGMPGLEKRLARFPQFYSRIGFAHQFRPLQAEEVRFIVATQWQALGRSFSATDFTDTEALAAVLRITGGNFRLLQRLFMQIERILEINDLRTVTKEVVEAARENLVIGTV